MINQRVRTVGFCVIFYFLFFNIMFIQSVEIRREKYSGIWELFGSFTKCFSLQR